MAGSIPIARNNTSRSRRRRSSPSYLRWLYIFVATAVIRTIYKSVVFTRRSATVIGDWDAPQQYLYPADGYPLRPAALRPQRSSSPQRRRQSRVQRPRKNPSQESLKSVRLGLGVRTKTKTKTTTFTGYGKVVDSSVLVQPSPSILKGKEKYDSYWEELCRGGKHGRALSSQSRVLLSGILSHTVAVELAWALSTHCGVSTLVGLSSNYHEDDFNIPPRIAFLLRRLPNFQLVHHNNHALEDDSTPQQKLDALIASVKPTHVVHFEVTTLFSPESVARITNTIRVRESLQTVDRLGRAIVKWQHQKLHLHHNSKRKTKGKEEDFPVRWLYVSTPPPQDNIYQAGALNRACPLLLQTFRLHYNLDVNHLKLPNIYGPFRESKLSAESLLLPDSSSRSDDLPLAHIDDCVESLVASLSSTVERKNNVPVSLPQFQIPQSSVTATKDLIRNFQNAITNDTITESTNDRARLMVSWQHQDVFPFEDPTDTYDINNTMKTLIRKAVALTKRRLVVDKTAGISLLHKRQNALFPCDSECSVNVPCRTRSVFTELLPISQNITQNCRFVLYTADFSSEISDLPIIPETTYIEVPWPKELLCQVAFVSGKSTLVQSLLQEAREQTNLGQVDMDSLNGNLQHNQWTLIWLPDDDESSLSEADYLFPKLSPGPFFAHRVTKCMYVQTQRGKQSIPSSTFLPMPVIWFLLAKRMDSKRQPQKSKIIRRSGTSVSHTVTLPAVPARHVALFAHFLGIPSSFVQSSSMETVAKYVLKKKGIIDFADRALPKRQLEYYDFAKSWYDFQLPDTHLLVHNLDSDQSRRLRCDWYEEHLFWADDYNLSNRDLDDLSLAYVLGRWRAEQRLVAHDDYSAEWGDRIVDTAKDDLVEIASKNVSSDSFPSQYFVKLHDPVKNARNN